MSTMDASERTGRAGAVLLWFAVLGGALAWAVHVVWAWGFDEVTCASGHESVQGLSLYSVLLISVLVPGGFAFASLVVALVVWWRLRGSAQRGRSFARVRMFAIVAVWANVLFVTMIALDGVALAVISPCQT